MKSEDILQSLLHDTLILGLKTQSFHWNVEGPHFGPLHTLFGTQYEALQEAADTIAERLRALGDYPHPHNNNKGGEVVDEIPKEPPDAAKMVEILALDHQKLGLFCAKTSDSVAKKDPATANMLADRQMAHEKDAWMLRSHLK